MDDKTFYYISDPPYHQLKWIGIMDTKCLYCCPDNIRPDLGEVYFEYLRIWAMKIKSNV